jgi:REP element-mobilizing transposase RayT
MPHSHVTALFHIVFSTKERMQLIRPEIQPRLWNYMKDVAHNHRIRVLAIGGMDDHIHALVSLCAEASVAEVVRTLKCNSSRWLRETKPLFCWQEGYGAFSISPSQVERVRRYIHNQREHHARRSFDDELRAMLAAARMSNAVECRP